MNRIKKNKYIGGIYCIENLINGKKYIGHTRNLCQRGSIHFTELQTNTHTIDELQNDYNKYGITNFIYRVLETCSGKDLFLKENEYIKRFNSVENGYNSTYGGEAGAKFVDSFPPDIREAIEIVKKDDHNIRLSKEKNSLKNILSSYEGKRIYSQSQKQQEFKEKFFNALITPKKTNHRRQGVRAINSVIEEDGLPYKIESKQMKKRNKNRHRTYWIISKK